MSELIASMPKPAREHREQREQLKPVIENMVTNEENIAENGGNKLMTPLTKPIFQPGFNPKNSIIKRPSYQSHSDWFLINGKNMKPGLYWHDSKIKKDGTSYDIDIWISNPIEVLAITSSVNKQDFGRLLKFLDSNGDWHTWAMPMHTLKGSGDELRGELLNQGFTFEYKKRSNLIDYLMSTRCYKKMTAATAIGWYGNSYVLPNQVIGADDIVYQSEIIGIQDFQSRSTLLDWQKEIGSLCIGNIPLMVSVSCALSGPLLTRVNRQQGSTIHWVGDSSSGKSTAVEVAASVWGSHEFIRSWSATANGMEGIAARRNDNCLILDEIDEAPPHEVGKIAYMLANGQGKQRAGRIGNARKIQRWRLMALSTGERTLERIMSEIGKQANTGQSVRLLSIPAEFEFGTFSNLHHFHDGRTFSDHLKTVRQKHYGTLGPAFIKHLQEDNQDLKSKLNTYTHRLSEQALTNIENRAASTFALIALAGELAIEYKLLPWEIGSVFDAAEIAFKRWQQFHGRHQNEDTRILNNVRNFITKYGDSRFSDHCSHGLATSSKVIERAGWYKELNGERIYMFTSEGLQEAGGKYELPRIITALDKNHWIAKHNGKRKTNKTRTTAGPLNLYYIKEPNEN